MAQNEREHWWFVGRREIIGSIIRHRIDPDRNARILEAGCGSGGNLELLRTFGALEAFEQDAEARAVAHERSGLPIGDGSLPDNIPFDEGSFDLVVLLDVLEHIEDDEATLRSLGHTLAPGGRLLITVPALPSLWSDHDVAHHHKRRYLKSTLTETCRRAGLTVDAAGYFNSLLLPLAAAHRWLSRTDRGNAAADAMPHPILNALFLTIFKFERTLLKWINFPLGLSLYTIVRSEKS